MGEIRCRATEIAVVLAMAAALLLPCAAATAGEPFHTTADEMIRELNREPQKYRTLFPKTRTIVVMEKKEKTVGVTEVVVDNSMDIPKVRTMILFDFDSARVRPESYPLLREVGIALNSTPVGSRPVMVNGHADSDGSAAYNLWLSLDRASAVREFLVHACDVSPSRLMVRGYGEYLPLVAEVDSRAKQQNRRVEFELVR